MTFPNIKRNPFFPALEGNHEDSQPSGSGLTENDAFAGFYYHDESGGTINDYDINYNEKWLFGPEPDLGNENFNDVVAADMSSFIATTPNSTNAIPGNGGGYFYTMDGSGYIRQTDTTVSPSVVIEYPCKYNSYEHMFDDYPIMVTAIINLEVLRTTGYSDGFIDPAQASEDRVWWDAVEAIGSTLTDLQQAHNVWQGNYVDGVADNYSDGGISIGNPATLADTFDSLIDSFYDDCYGTTGRLLEIESRLGTPYTTGYIKDLYDISNLLAGKDVGVIREAYSDLVSIISFYDRIDDLRAKYRGYEKASPN